MIGNKITDLDIKTVYLNTKLDWNTFKDKTIYITGGTGVIGSFIIRCLLYANKQDNLNIKIVAAVRNTKKAKKFFGEQKEEIELFLNDVNNPIIYQDKVDYIIHAASNTSSSSFIENPTETYNVAINGTRNILNFAKEKNCESVVYLSSMEVYGNINRPKPLTEDDLGDIDESNPRSSYPLGKRAAEKLCYSLAKEQNIPVKVIRPAQVLGSNVHYYDSRVYGQFARSIVEKKDIVLNTKAEALRSNCYITDAVEGILTILIKGKNGECYNLANDNFSSISQTAQKLVEKHKRSKLIFDLEDGNIYPPDTHWVLDCSKLKALNWEAKVTLDESYEKLIKSFRLQRKKMKKLKPLEYLFSVKNKARGYKQITILGISIKYNYVRKNIKLCQKTPIQKNKIVFMNYLGKPYGCNPKYIVEEIIKRKLPLDLVWLCDKNSLRMRKQFPKQVRLVKYKSTKCIKEMASAKFWISNMHFVPLLKSGLEKKENQIYLQTWHGSLGIKRIENDVTHLKEDKKFQEYAIQNANDTDYWITNSTFEKDVFKKAFWDIPDEKFLNLGHARNDIFFYDNNELSTIKKKVYSKLKIDSNKKILIYAPTFRDFGNMECYQIDTDNILKAVKEKFNEQWVIAIRMHPRLTKKSKELFDFSNKNIVDASIYPDIQELLVSSDMIITDYSSCIFDFMLTRKAGFIFATDIYDYNTERGFYYPLETTPFPIATNNEQLIENIKNFDYKKYKNDVEMFLQEKGCTEDGKASKRIVDMIEDEINK